MTLPAPPFLSAILLADEEAHAAVDRRSLRGAGIRHIRVVTSGCEVARFLASNIPNTEEVIVCPPRAADMDARQFAALIRSHPLLPHVPLVALTSDATKREELEQAGFNAVLQRPFNAQDLQKALREAMRHCRKAHALLATWLRTLDKLPDHTEFDELLAACSPVDRGALTAAEACRRGLALLRERNLDDALPLLQKASVDCETSGDACAALSALYKARGESVKAAQALKASLRGYIDIQAWGKAGQVAACLSREAPGEAHPLLGEVERAARQGKAFVVQELMDMLLADSGEREDRSSGPMPEDVLAALERGLSGLPSEQAADTRETLELALLQSGRAQLARMLSASPPAASYESARPDNAGQISAAFCAYVPPTASSPPLPLSDDRPDTAPEAGNTDIIAPLTDAPAPLAPSRLPSLLGEVMTVIRGTLRLYKASK